MPAFDPRWTPTERFDRAFALARSAHARQSRKTEEGVQGIPYISHLMAVSALVIENGGTEDQAIAGLLHDLIEDTACTFEDIDSMFGSMVTDIVRACTDGDSQSKGSFETPEQKLADWRARKEAYLRALNAKDAENPSLLVALADKVHNATMTEADLRDMTSDERTRYFGKFTAGEAHQRWWYEGLAEQFTAKVAARPDLAWATLATEFARLVGRMFP